jgi:CitMHS family citrate-Mg2+:H+ or citrate-Ca2+:H+ symporter
MLTLLGFGMVLTFMVLIMTKKLSPLLALIIVPILFGLIGGFGSDLRPMMLDGIKNLAPIAVMLMFAILFFGVMIDTGLFEPIVKRIIKIVGGDPLKIILATAALSLFVSLDGDGSTAYMITGAALLPLYRRTGINPLIFTCIMMMSGSLMNLTPWGGPTARAASVLKLTPNELFLPMIPVMIVCALWIFVAAYFFGIKERKRLGIIKNLTVLDNREEEFEENNKPQSEYHRKMLPINFLITLALMVSLVLNVLPLPVLFMVGFCVALIVNYPNPDQQRERLISHAGNALSVSSMIFAAGIFTGILSGTGMVDAMAGSVVSWIPERMSPYLPIIIAGLSLPFTFFISNDAFYFGILPILMTAAAKYGFTPGEVGIASLVGQQVHLLSPLVPSTYLLVGLAKVELGDHQRFTLPWALGSSVVMLLAALIFGVIPLSH